MARDLEERRRRRRKEKPSLVGTTLQGRYHLVRKLGDGGMGSVYKAADQVLRRFVAIKMLHPTTAENASSVERFVREARSAAAIGHPNIIDILDFGHEDKRPFLVMEYLRGRSLSEVIHEEGRLSVERACKIATHALAGLAAAHDRGILHRDLKPANLMLIALLGDADFVKLCDFGFAALVTPTVRIDGGKELTPARTLVGTPAYCAPERLRGDDRRDRRLDVYSVGVVLYEMLAGQRPFDAPTFRQLARLIRTEPPPRLRAVRRDVPRGLEKVIEKALAKDREKRWSSCQDFAAALVPFGGRSVPQEDFPSDSFTMDLLRIRARETQQQKVVTPSEAEQILELRRKARREREAERKRRASELPPPPPAPSPRTEPVDDTTPFQHPGGFLPDATERQIAMPPIASPSAPPIAPPPLASALMPSAAPSTDDATSHSFSQVGLEGDTQVDDRLYAGGVALSILRFVSRRHGERALTEVLELLPAVARVVFENGVTESDWIPFGAVDALMQAVDAKLGRDDLHLVVQCGRAAAEGAFDRMRALRPPAPPPELLLSEMPTVLAALVRGIDVTVGRMGRGYARLEVDETGESSLTFGVFLIGFLDRSLDRFGASEVEVSLISSPALGDEQCVYEISWIA